MPDYTNTNTTVNPDGSIGANFPGGLTIPLPNDPNFISGKSVKWIQEDNGAQVAIATARRYTTLFPTANQSQLILETRDNNNIPRASIGLNSVDGPGTTGGAVTASARGVATQTVNIIDGEGNSGFVRNAGGPNTSSTVNGGRVTLTFSGDYYSNFVAMPHGLGKIPKSATASPIYFPDLTCSIYAVDADFIYLKAYYRVVLTGSYDFFWMAIS